jgi:hypothetical protein
MVLPWGNHFEKRTVSSLTYFLNYSLLSYSAQSQILVTKYYLFRTLNFLTIAAYIFHEYWILIGNKSAASKRILSHYDLTSTVPSFFSLSLFWYTALFAWLWSQNPLRPGVIANRHLAPLLTWFFNGIISYMLIIMRSS